MQEINLLQNKIKDRTLAWERRNQLITTGLVFLFLVTVGIYAMLFVLNANTKKKTESILAENSKLQAIIDSKSEEIKAAAAFQAQLKNLKTLLADHVHWSRFFDELSAFTYNKGQYLTMRGDTSGKVHLEGIIPTYTDLGKLILGITTSTNLTKANLLSVTPSSFIQSGYLFSVDLTAEKGIFKNK